MAERVRDGESPLEFAHTDCLSKGRCPNCWSTRVEIGEDYFRCPACGLHGNPKMMKWCLKVPMFEPAKDDAGQQFELDGKFYKLAGYAPGCGRPVAGDFCTACRASLPKKSDSSNRPTARRKARDTTP